jgi:hypothetical protein
LTGDTWISPDEMFLVNTEIDTLFFLLMFSNFSVVSHKNGAKLVKKERFFRMISEKK